MITSEVTTDLSERDPETAAGGPGAAPGEPGERGAAPGAPGANA